jgi:hypothetical protein
MNTRNKSLIIGFLVALLTISFIIWIMPCGEDFHPLNTDWNGFSIVSAELNLSLVDKIDLITESQALLIIGPSKPFEKNEINRLKQHLENSGLIIIADDFGYGNQILEGLGINVKINGSLLLDPLIKHRGKSLPKAIFNDSEIVLNYGSIVEGVGFQILARSSEFSFLDLNLNMITDEDEPQESFPVAARIQLERGIVIVVSDSSLLINSMTDFSDNIFFFKSIAGDRELVLDTSHWTLSTVSKAKDVLKFALQFLNLLEVKYMMITALILMMINIRKAESIENRSSIQDILEKHPEWDESILMKLKSDMKREDKDGD